MSCLHHGVMFAEADFGDTSHYSVRVVEVLGDNV